MQHCRKCGFDAVGLISDDELKTTIRFERFTKQAAGFVGSPRYEILNVYRFTSENIKNSAAEIRELVNIGFLWYYPGFRSWDI